ncbi:MAG: hypothetical protein KDJ29_19890 [Hyphomicrobiales bacterium]|nr:hypothetical protein [Hyphomicrobiales bacterium]
MTDVKEKAKDQFTGVRAKLAAAKAAEAEKSVKPNEGFPLPHSGIICQIPGHINHGAWLKAQRQGKGDIGAAQTAFISEVVLFEGEKLTIADVRELLDARDFLALVGEIFGDDDEDKDEEKNG